MQLGLTKEARLCNGGQYPGPRLGFPECGFLSPPRPGRRNQWPSDANGKEHPVWWGIAEVAQRLR